MARSDQREERDLLRMRRAVGKGEQALAELDRLLLSVDGICPSDLSILDRLSRKGPEAVNALGRRIGLTSGSITTAVQRLRKRGLISTLRVENDKRVVSVEVTPEGIDLAKRLTKKRSEALKSIFADWSPRERDLLQSLLKRVQKTTKEYQARAASKESRS